MNLRWVLVAFDVIIGGRYGDVSATQNALLAYREDKTTRARQRRFDQAHDAVRDALDDLARRRAIEDELLSRYGEGR